MEKQQPAPAPEASTQLLKLIHEFISQDPNSPVLQHSYYQQTHSLLLKHPTVLLNFDQKQSFILKFLHSTYQLFDTISQTPKEIIDVAEQALYLSIVNIDPSLQFLKSILSPIRNEYCEKSIVKPCKLSLAIRLLSKIFENQTPLNQEPSSFFYLKGNEGISTIEEHVKWPYEKHPIEEGCTLMFWCKPEIPPNAEARIMSLTYKDKNGTLIGFQISLKNEKFYYQRIEEEKEKKFSLAKSLTKNKQIYLCDLPNNNSQTLMIQFEMKRKIIFSTTNFINIYSKQLNINNIEIDMPSFTTDKKLTLELFKGFSGAVSNVLLVAKNVAPALEENNVKSFLLENEIRNLGLMMDSNLKSIVLLYSPNRAAQADGSIEIYDVFNRNSGMIKNESGTLVRNMSIKKEIINYGSFAGYLSLLNIIEKTDGTPLELSTLFNDYLELIKNLLLNKGGAQEECVELQGFSQLKLHIEKTQMREFNERTIYLLKEIYVALNNRNIRQYYLKNLIWALNPAEFLGKDLFGMYINLIKTFYNEDVHTVTQVFGIRDIITFLLDHFEAKCEEGSCCSQHSKQEILMETRGTTYRQILSRYLQIVENIVSLKRYLDESELPSLILELIQVFTLKVSGCFSLSFLTFLEAMASRDTKIDEEISNQLKTPESKLLIYSYLANTSSYQLKGQILKNIIFRQYREYQNFLKEPSTSYELAVCLKSTNALEIAYFNSGFGDDLISNSSDKSSEPKSTSMTEVARYFSRSNSGGKVEPMDCKELAQVIIDWAYNAPREQSWIPNNGFLLLCSVYGYSTAQVRRYIWQEIQSRVQKTRFEPEIVIWLVQSLLGEVLKGEDEDEQLRESVIMILTHYMCDRILNEDGDQVAIIMNSVLRSVFNFKYTNENKESQMVAYLLLFNSISSHLASKEVAEKEIKTYGKNILNAFYCHMTGYFVLQKMLEDSEAQESPESRIDYRLFQLPLSILENFYKVLLNLTLTSEDSRILTEQNTYRNASVLELLLKNRGKEQEQSSRPTLLSLVFVMLQTCYDSLDDHEIMITTARKRCLSIISNILLYMMQLSENSGEFKMNALYEQQFTNLFLNVLGFVEMQNYRYFHYKVERGSLDFLAETKIRSNINQLRQVCLDIFVKVIELLKKVDDIIGKEHKSFYQLINKKKNMQFRLQLNNFYARAIKQTDDKFNEFYFIDDVRKNALDKLQTMLLQRKISRSCATVEKLITKSLEEYRRCEELRFTKIEKTSMGMYNDVEKEKYKTCTAFQEKMNVLRMDSRSRQRIAAARRIAQNERDTKVVKKLKWKIWERARIYEGFLAPQNFYSFSQNDNNLEYNNQLSRDYCRVRSSKQTRQGLMPFIRIRLKSNHVPCLQDYPTEEIPYMESTTPSKSKIEQNKKSQKYLKLGLQFIKKKFIDKIIRPSQERSNSQLAIQNLLPGGLEEQIFNDITWNHHMVLHCGQLRLTRDYKMIFHFKPCYEHSHISMFKYQYRENKPLKKTWLIENVESIEFKKFLLKNNTVQIKLKNGKSILFSFLLDDTRVIEFAETLYKFKKIQLHESKGSNLEWTLRPLQPAKLIQKSDLVKRWLNSEISNFDYLMALNMLSGRSNVDLNQYPVFPWVLNNYLTTKLPKDGSHNYRDLGKNMGCLGSFQRTEKFRRIYEQNEHFKEGAQQYHFGFHYSNIPIVLQYLIRVNPFTEAAKLLQGGKFDVPDRLFCSLADSYGNATKQMSDLRELIPQFFYLPQFLMNSEDYEFGIQQNQKIVNHVQLPEGCCSPYDFIENHREALESPYVTENLHKWIDMVFGYKNSGRQADLSLNKYYYLTYEENVDILEQPSEDKKALESQVAFFGKTPSQLFSKPHPQKRYVSKKFFSPTRSRRMKCFVNPDSPPSSTNSISSASSSQSIRSKHPLFALSPDSIIHFSYNQSSNRFCIIRRDGQGRLFTIQASSTQCIIQKSFSFSIDKYEKAYCLDERREVLGSEESVFMEFPMVCLQGGYLLYGGVWGGKLLCYDFYEQKFEAYWKHTDTIVSMALCEKLRVVVTGSFNGETVVWEYDNKCKLFFRSKVVNHGSRVNHISINQNMGVYISSQKSGFVDIIDIFSASLLRTIRIGEGVLWSLGINYPFHMVVIGTSAKQICYSVNGQYLDQAAYQVRLVPIMHKHEGFRDKLMMKLTDDRVVFTNLPDFRVESKFELRKEDLHTKHLVLNKYGLVLATPEFVVVAYEAEEHIDSPV